MSKKKVKPKSWILNNKKVFTHLKGSEDWAGIPRCYWTKAKGKRCPSVLVKCSDCENKVRIDFDAELLSEDGMIEIGGVIAHKEWWKILFKKVGLL